MHQKPPVILGLNPGTKYLGYAIFQETDLREWGVKTFPGKWSKKKQGKIQRIVSDLITRYQVTAISIKKLHLSRSSRRLNDLVACLIGDSERSKLKVYQYSIREIKAFYSSYTEEPIKNKKDLSLAIATQHPILFTELEKERTHKNRYRSRMFEAVALASISITRMRT
jgi:Holliday junction resolvasome RuvABC endonuclease subunit